MTEEVHSKREILDAIQGERAALEAAIDPLTETQMIQPGVEHDWSIKDILAHITDWENRMITWIEESLLGEVPQRPAPGMTWDDLDLLNQQTYLANKDRPLDEVLTEFRSSYQQALETVRALSEDDLINPPRFAWREGDPLWHMVGANTWWHYKEHRQSIAAWL